MNKEIVKLVKRYTKLMEEAKTEYELELLYNVVIDIAGLILTEENRDELIPAEIYKSKKKELNK